MKRQISYNKKANKLKALEKLDQFINANQEILDAPKPNDI